jgi:hypothetical protein
LREQLREPFRTLEPDDVAYEVACSRFEFLASLISMDDDKNSLAGPWSGEFFLDSHWGYAGGSNGLAGEIAEEMTESWPLLLDGAFNGDLNQAQAAFKRLAEFRARRPHW